MIKGNKHIILTELQDAINVGFYEEEDSSGILKGAEITFEGIFKDEYTIPKTIWVLSEDTIESYDIVGAKEFSIVTCTIDYNLDCEYELNEAGKEQYNLYCMMYNVGDKDGNQIDIDEFIEQYTY